MLRRLTRRVSAAVLFAVLRLRARPVPALSPGSVLLVVAPHPDDESLGCGRLIAAYGESSVTVHLAWLTDGDASHSDIDPVELARRRRTEAAAAADVLGVPPARRHQFGAPDGDLPALSPDQREVLIARLAALMTALQPAEVYVTSACDGSTEHAAAHALVVAGIARVNPPPRLRTYLVWAHWNVRALVRIAFGPGPVYWRPDPAHNDRRRAAIAAHRTQTRPFPPATTPLLSSHFLACFPSDGEIFLER
jgi:LmbE family N-acetylglucosaminyl deacetylase